MQPGNNGRDKRAYPRVPTTLNARIRIEAEGLELDCVVVDLAPGGAGIQMPQEAGAGLVCSLEIDAFGRFDGITTHAAGGVLGVRFLFGEADRLNLLGKLTRFVDNGLRPRGENGPANTLALRTSAGALHHCEVLSIALTGVMLRSSARLPTGAFVSVGRMYGRVATQHAAGIGVEFLSIMSGEPCSPASP